MFVPWWFYRKLSKVKRNYKKIKIGLYVNGGLQNLNKLIFYFQNNYLHVFRGSHPMGPIVLLDKATIINLLL